MLRKRRLTMAATSILAAAGFAFCGATAASATPATPAGPAAPVAQIAPNLMAVHAATARAALARSSCDPGYAPLLNYSGYYLNSDGPGDRASDGTNSNYCVLTGGAGSTGTISTESGHCFGLNTAQPDTSDVYLEDCNGGIWQQWAEVANLGGGVAFVNEDEVCAGGDSYGQMTPVSDGENADIGCVNNGSDLTIWYP